MQQPAKTSRLYARRPGRRLLKIYHAILFFSIFNLLFNKCLLILLFDRDSRFSLKSLEARACTLSVSHATPKTQSRDRKRRESREKNDEDRCEL